jgi:hypothetical protein
MDPDLHLWLTDPHPTPDSNPDLTADLYLWLTDPDSDLTPDSNTDPTQDPAPDPDVLVSDLEV